MTRRLFALLWAAALASVLCSCFTIDAQNHRSLTPKVKARHSKAMLACVGATSANISDVLAEFDSLYEYEHDLLSFDELAAMLHMRAYACTQAAAQEELRKTWAMSAAEYRDTRKYRGLSWEPLLAAWKQGPGWMLPNCLEAKKLELPPLVSLPPAEALEVTEGFYKLIVAQALDWSAKPYGSMETIFSEAEAFEKMGEKDLAALARSYSDDAKVLRLALRWTYLDRDPEKAEHAKALMAASGMDPAKLRGPKAKEIVQELLNAAGRWDLAKSLDASDAWAPNDRPAMSESAKAEAPFMQEIDDLRQSLVRIAPPNPYSTLSYKSAGVREQLRYAIAWRSRFLASWNALSPERKARYRNSYLELIEPYVQVLIEHAKAPMTFVDAISKRLDDLQAAQGRGDTVYPADIKLVRDAIDDWGGDDRWGEELNALKQRAAQAALAAAQELQPIIEK